MAKTSVTFRLLSLFTSPDRAESIEGDLLEERHSYGRVWFAVNVATTAFALWRQALAFELTRTVALSVAAVALSCLVCGGLELARGELAPLELSPVVMLLLIAAFAFLLGAGLVRVAPVIGVPAAVAASLALVFLFLYTQADLRTEQWRDAAEGNSFAAAVRASVSLSRDLVAAVLLYVLPLNLGSVLMHGRGVRR